MYFFYEPCLHVLPSDSSLFQHSHFHALLLTTVKYLHFLRLSGQQDFSFLSLYQYCHGINRKQEISQAVKCLPFW